MDELKRQHAEFAAICRTHGWKCTSQRWSVYHYLAGNRTHPTVEMVWEAIRREHPAIGRDSVYRILNDFVEKKLLERLDHIESARYDTNMAPHGHFICLKCHKVLDFNPGDLRIWRGNADFGNVQQVELRLTGICSACQEQNS